jgi:hypothetical protein
MEKYKTYLQFLIAKIHKNIKRYKISKLFSWEPLPPLKSGCTAIIGMCSRMPYVLGANLYCLNKSQWENLKEVIITVDAEKGALPDGFEEDIIQKFPQLKITFFYYNRQQAEFTAKINDPYIYSWLSWGTCMNHVRTKTVLIQDYDALVLSGKALEKRYHAFIESGAKIQGITWCKISGFEAEDHLATTFEAFLDVNWIRSFPPVMGYNRVGLLKGRKVDYDTYLDIQANHTPENQRTIIPMSGEELVHPSQMITQYMRFRNSPGKTLPCFSVIMTPFFLIQDYDALVLSGKALEKRYHAFIESGAKIQGITWCKISGFEAEDHLATTFEAFLDVNWIRSFPPVMGYNRVGLLKGRKVDYDTYLDIQANHTPENQRTIIPMSGEELVHPSQMITQYMRFRNSPGKTLPCFSVIMTPFFYFLSGQENAITNATEALKQENPKRVNLLSDGVLINLSQLETKAVDFMLKLMIQVLVTYKKSPYQALIDYGTALYKACKTPADQIWVGDFTDAQREWIEAAKVL